MARLTYEQRRTLVEEGYLVIPGVVPSNLTGAALRAINNSLGKGMSVRDTIIGRAMGYCSELNSEGVILDLLYETDIWELAKSLLGESSIRKVENAQIALRFPEGHNVLSVPIPEPHIDGIPTPYNGITGETFTTFNLLVGVFLSDVPTGNAGNLVVWPRSHEQYEAYFRRHGPDGILDGMPQVGLLRHREIKAQAGDVILSHYLLAHSVAPNLSPNIRYAIYFRLTTIGHCNWRESLLHIWNEWPGACDIAIKLATGRRE